MQSSRVCCAIQCHRLSLDMREAIIAARRGLPSSFSHYNHVSPCHNIVIRTIMFTQISWGRHICAKFPCLLCKQYNGQLLDVREAIITARHGFHYHSRFIIMFNMAAIWSSSRSCSLRSARDSTFVQSSRARCAIQWAQTYYVKDQTRQSKNVNGQTMALVIAMVMVIGLLGVTLQHSNDTTTQSKQRQNNNMQQKHNIRKPNQHKHHRQ